jgi:hypothetical protein
MLTKILAQVIDHKLVKFFQGVLQWDPSKRSTATQVLKEDLFKGVTFSVCDFHSRLL